VIIVIASRYDEVAAALAARWDAALLTPVDLSATGWRYYVAAPELGTAVGGGQRVPNSEIAGVLTRLPVVYEQELDHVDAEDRAYVACEMKAFLLAWLSALRCPVLNRPSPECLCGPAWRTEWWVGLAARLGIPVQPLRRDSTVGFVPDCAPSGAVVTVVGERCFGSVDSSVAEHARRLASAAAVDLLEVRFTGPDYGSRFVQANLCPDLSTPEVADAVLDRLRAQNVGRAFSSASAGMRQTARRPERPPQAGSPHPLVLLWGLEADTPLAVVRHEFEALGVPTIFVNQREVLDMDFRMTAGETVDAAIRIQQKWVDLSDVTAAYLRPFSSCQLPAIAKGGPESPASQHAAAVDDFLFCWAELTGALLINPLAAMSGNGSKPYQLEQLRRIGWSVPETLITTDPDAAREFWERHGEVIYKSVSGVRSKVSRLRPDHLERFASISSCPTQLQQYIAGTDHRIHVVGSEVFACEVRSEADDYRYPGEGGVEVRPCALTFDVEELCLRTAEALELPFVGIDLRLTPEGEWFCFEANPSPGFTYYENAAGLPIARAVAGLLTGVRAASYV
jgi:hypothetical protein